MIGLLKTPKVARPPWLGANQGWFAAVAGVAEADTQVLPEAVLPALKDRSTLPPFPAPGLDKTRPAPDAFPAEKLMLPVGESWVSQALSCFW